MIMKSHGGTIRNWSGTIFTIFGGLIVWGLTLFVMLLDWRHETFASIVF
jgi:hypothetical protein